MFHRLRLSGQNTYIDIRKNNPSLRVRSDSNLGPRVTVDVANAVRTTLERPEEYFVDMVTYLEDNPGVTVAEADKQYEFIDGNWVEGVSHL